MAAASVQCCHQREKMKSIGEGGSEMLSLVALTDGKWQRHQLIVAIRRSTGELLKAGELLTPLREKTADT